MLVHSKNSIIVHFNFHPFWTPQCEGAIYLVACYIHSLEFLSHLYSFAAFPYNYMYTCQSGYHFYSPRAYHLQPLVTIIAITT